MTLNVGKNIVYPYRGPCRIGAIVKRSFGGRVQNFYPLNLMDGSRDVVFIPVDKVAGLGMRQLLQKSEIPKLLRSLREDLQRVALPTSRMSWKQRAADNSSLLASRSAYDLARLVGSLTELSETKSLAPHERAVLDKAKKQLVCEISAVMGQTTSDAEQQVNDALNTARQIV